MCLSVSNACCFQPHYSNESLPCIFDAEVLWPRSRTVQGHPRSKVMVPIDSSWVISYSISIDPVHRICQQFWNIWCEILMPLNQYSSRSSKVKGHGAKRKPIGVFYMTSIESKIASLTTFEIFDVNVLWPRSRTVQDHSRSKMVVPIDSTRLTFYSTSIDSIIVSVAVFEIFDCNFDELKLGLFKVIQVQRL